MSIFEDGSYSNILGTALIAKVLAGRCKMQYTRASVGKGKIAEGENPRTMQQPADYVMEAKISAVTNPVNGECQVTVQVDSSEVEKGFYVTGIVLYANDPDEGEIPYTYLVLENEPEWIRPSSAVIGKLATFELIAAVGDIDKVTAIINPDAIVTCEVVEKLIDESIEHYNSIAEEVHADIRKSITDLTQEKMHLKNGFYIHQADGGNNSQNGYIHFASIELLHTATAADISMPITFEVIGSDYKSPITIIVTFEPYVASSSMTVNAKLKAIYYDNNTNYVDIFAQTIYYTPSIRKNKINLYIQKKTKDTLIYITDFKSSYNDSNIISVSFTNDFLQTKPTGSTVKGAVFQLNANTLDGYLASSFLPVSSSGNKVVRANGFDVHIYDDNNEYPELDSELKIRLGRIDVIRYINALNKNKSVGVLSRDKIEFNANNVAIKALPDNNLGDGVKGSLTLSIGGVKVFDFGNEQISYIRPIRSEERRVGKECRL